MMPEAATRVTVYPTRVPAIRYLRILGLPVLIIHRTHSTHHSDISCKNINLGWDCPTRRILGKQHGALCTQDNLAHRIPPFYILRWEVKSSKNNPLPIVKNKYFARFAKF